MKSVKKLLRNLAAVLCRLWGVFPDPRAGNRLWCGFPWWCFRIWSCRVFLVSFSLFYMKVNLHQYIFCSPHHSQQDPPVRDIILKRCNWSESVRCPFLLWLNMLTLLSFPCQNFYVMDRGQVVHYLARNSAKLSLSTAVNRKRWLPPLNVNEELLDLLDIQKEVACFAWDHQELHLLPIRGLNHWRCCPRLRCCPQNSQWPVDVGQVNEGQSRGHCVVSYPQEVNTVFILASQSEALVYKHTSPSQQPPANQLYPAETKKK